MATVPTHTVASLPIEDLDLLRLHFDEYFNSSNLNRGLRRLLDNDFFLNATNNIEIINAPTYSDSTGTSGQFGVGKRTLEHPTDYAAFLCYQTNKWKKIDLNPF